MASGPRQSTGALPPRPDGGLPSRGRASFEDSGNNDTTWDGLMLGKSRAAHTGPTGLWDILYRPALAPGACGKWASVLMEGDWELALGREVGHLLQLS